MAMKYAPSCAPISNAEQQLDMLAACGRLALTAGRRERSGPALSLVEEDEVERPRGGTVANINGINVYASSPVDGADRATLERLCRYLLRGPLAQHRLKQRPDGMLTYRLKKPDRRGTPCWCSHRKSCWRGCAA